MKMMRTRLLSFALAVMMVLSMLPGTALAQGSFSYTVDGMTTYTATLEEAITAANGYLAKGQNVVVDLFADAIDLAEGVIVTSRGKTATLTVNMNGHKMESA